MAITFSGRPFCFLNHKIYVVQYLLLNPLDTFIKNIQCGKKRGNLVHAVNGMELINLFPFCLRSIPLVIYSLQSYFSLRYKIWLPIDIFSCFLLISFDTLTIQKAWIWLVMDPCNKKNHHSYFIFSRQGMGGGRGNQNFLLNTEKLAYIYEVKTRSHFWGFVDKGWVRGGN